MENANAAVPLTFLKLLCTRALLSTKGDSPSPQKLKILKKRIWMLTTFLYVIEAYKSVLQDQIRALNPD